jgi:hypothetical protein
LCATFIGVSLDLEVGARSWVKAERTHHPGDASRPIEYPMLKPPGVVAPSKGADRYWITLAMTLMVTARITAPKT